MEEKTRLVTRPKLASKLMEAGFVGRKTVNPWSPERTAWEFPATPEVLEIIGRDYLEHDLTVVMRRRERQKAKKGGDTNEV